MTTVARATVTALRAAWETGHVLADDGTVHLLQGDETVCGEGAHGDATVESVTCETCSTWRPWVESPVAADLDLTRDFERVRAGMRVEFYHHASNRYQIGTVLAWAPEHFANAVAEPVCLNAVAVVHVADLALGNGYSAGEKVLRLRVSRHGGCVKRAWVCTVWPADRVR